MRAAPSRKRGAPEKMKLSNLETRKLLSTRMRAGLEQEKAEHRLQEYAKAKQAECEQLHGELSAKHGEIIVDAKGATSVPGVFAAGDVTTVPFKQIIIAAGDGAKAALGAFDHLMRS